MIKRILVPTHGTEGARKAEEYALNMAKALGASVYGLYIIHKGWSSIAGIDWLNTSETRMQFYRHVEDELERRANEVLNAFTKRAHDMGITIETEKVVGEPVKVILEAAERLDADLIVMGGPSNRRSEEYKAKIPFQKLIKHSSRAILMVK
ncbi:MAG: universal stress protein [Nitrospirae bacterium]|nr:universal stress protein [Nitrospirota bacterium]